MQWITCPDTVFLPTSATTTFQKSQRVSLKTNAIPHTSYLACLDRLHSRWQSNDIIADPTVRKSLREWSDLEQVVAMTQYDTPGIKRCDQCHTEYIINYKDYYPYGKAMFLTRWKDLGLSPESKIWKQHITLRDPLGVLPLMNSIRARAQDDNLVFEMGSDYIRGMQWRSDSELREFFVKHEREPPVIKISSAFGDGDGFQFDE